ncbi:MAG: dTMP kinase [Candidatus Micrarchaeota archaeon]|nr:dTMP kinase [Candidatus Micrarchaeota archaeon]
MKGKFIVFEGIDKSGKTTQAKMLCDHLKSKGIDCVFCSEPTYENPIGLLIRDWLNGKIEIESGEAITLLYSADRYEDLKSQALPALESGKTVVMDRYYYSTLAYENSLYGIDKEWIKKIHEFVRKPDIVIFIDIPPEVSIERAGNNADRHEKLGKMEKVRKAYLELAKEKNFVVIDGNRPIEEVFKDAKRNLVDVLYFP